MSIRERGQLTGARVYRSQGPFARLVHSSLSRLVPTSRFGPPTPGVYFHPLRFSPLSFVSGILWRIPNRFFPCAASQRANGPSHPSVSSKPDRRREATQPKQAASKTKVQKPRGERETHTSRLVRDPDRNGIVHGIPVQYASPATAPKSSPHELSNPKSWHAD